MNVDHLDNEVGHDAPKRDEPSGPEVSHGDYPRLQEEKMQPDAGHKTFNRHAERKQTLESSKRKQRNGEGILMQKSLSCLDGNRGQAALNLMRSESAEGHNHGHRYQTLETDLPLNSKTVVLTQCDSSAHTTEARDCWSYKDNRFKDTESAVCSHAYTESLTCTFTDESFRDGHASLDMSTLKAEHDHSQSLSDTESVSDLQMTSNPRRAGRVEMYESYDYNLDTKVGMDFEHRLYHFPSYSDDSLTKSSELYPKSRYMTHSTSHLTSQVPSAPRQARPNNDPPSVAVSTKSSHSQNAAVCGFHSESCQDRKEHVRVVGDSVCKRMTPQSTCPPGYPHPAQPENTPVRNAYLESSPGGTAYVDNAFVHTKGTRTSSTKEPHRFNNPELQVNEANVSSMEDMILRGKCQLDGRVKDTNTCEQRQPVQTMLAESHRRLRELEGQLTSVDHRGEFDKPKSHRSPSHSVAVGTPKEYRSTSTQNEMVYEESTSLSRDLGIQVTIEASERKEAAINRGMPHAQKTWGRDPASRNVRASDDGIPEKPRKLHIQTEQLTGEVSDTESLDSEANYLLRQLQMAQMTKRKANSLLKHVQNILEQTDTVGDTSKREVDEGRAAARAESERGKHNIKRDHTPTELHFERSPHTQSVCATRTGRRRSTARELELNNCPKEELQPPSLRQVEAGDRGLVQTLVNTWDKHHKAVAQGKAGARSDTVTRSQTKEASNNRWSRRPSSEHRDKCSHEPSSERQQRRAPAKCDRQLLAAPATHIDKSTEGSPEKRSLELEMSENRVRVHSFERSHRWQKHATTELIPVPIGASTNVANDSTSLASVSVDSVSVNKKAAGKQARSSKNTHDDVVDKRVTSVPRKVRHKRRSSPEVYSRKDALKSKWRFDIDARRTKVRSASIKDSLRAAFKVAEESMTAAARVAEALNIVMKASLISPPSSSSVEDKYTRPCGRAEKQSPGIRTKRLEPATANCRSKTKPSPALSRSPGDVSLCLPSDQQASRRKERKLGKISEKSEKKKRSSHNYPISQDQSFGQKTCLSSPPRVDTFSRKPRSRRASNHQLDTKVNEYKQVHSQSSVTLPDISPQAWGDSTAISKRAPGQKQLTTDQQIIVQVAYTNSPELTSPQLLSDDNKVQIKKALTLNMLAKDDHSRDKQGPVVSFDSGEMLNSLKPDGKDGHPAPEATLSKSPCIDKKPGHESPVVSERERSSNLTLSKEEWIIPNPGCITGRKGDSYFTQNPPIIDQNLHSISLSAKQIIRRQLIGSCVDPGCTDSTCSDSVESNSNFNRSAAGRQLHLNIARKIERQQRQTKMNKHITSKCRQEMELSQSADPFIIWQCDASLQYEAECYPSDTNVFLHPDRGKPWPDTREENDSSRPAYRCISRSREESNTSRRATVHVQDTLRTSYQLHQEEILKIEDYFERSCTSQEAGPCVATLCYTDLSSPVSGCFNLPEYGRAVLSDRAETCTLAEVNISQHKKVEQKYDMSQHAEFDQKYDMSQHEEFDQKYDMSQHAGFDRKCDVSRNEELDRKYDMPQHGEFDQKYDMSQQERFDRKCHVSQNEDLDRKYDVSQHARFDQKYDMSQHEEFNRKYDMSQHERFDRKYKISKHEEVDQKYNVSHREEFDRKYDVSQYKEVGQKNPMQQSMRNDRYPYVDRGDTFESPRDTLRGHSSPTPKPRVRKQLSSDSDSFPLPGRTAQITKFSPIFEELCPEECPQSKHHSDLTCPQFKERPQDAKSSNTSSSSNCSIGSNNNNNSYTNNAANVVTWVREPCAHTKAGCQAVAAREVSHVANAVAPSHGNTSTSTEAQRASMNLCVSKQLSYSVSLQSLARSSLNSNSKVRSVDLGFVARIQPQLQDSSGVVLRPAVARES